MNSHLKPKSAAKDIIPKGDKLSKVVNDTMQIISGIVGATLGPGGSSVLIERQDYGMPNIITKDGVTVMRNLGFTDPTQHAIMEAARDAATKTVSEAGDGPQPLWANVLTPEGFVSMGEIQTGMKICGTNGTIQDVIGVYPKGQKEIFKITFSENRVVECCEDHVWTITTNYGATKTLTTKEMLKDFKTIQKDGSNSYRYYTPKTEVEFAEKDNLPLDPYLVGVLLGDGTLRDSGSIELSLGTNKEHILEKLILPNGLYLNKSYNPEKHYFRVKILGKTPDGKTIRDYICELGLRNVHSGNKFIPQRYLLSTIESRRALLQGLVDTDGYINNRGRFEFSTISQGLADDFIFLARSLGKSIYKKVHTREKDVNSYSDRSIYRIYELKGEGFGDKIINIEATGEYTEMQCIKVSNPDNLYITDDFVVTHNTTTATVLSEAIVRYATKYCKENPRVSPQRVVRRLEDLFKKDIEPVIKSLKLTPDNPMLHDVAKTSANGETELADAIMECFELVGDDGNITIIEQNGPSKYMVEPIKGFPIGVGVEDCCRQFYPAFLNDGANNRCYLEDPVFILYHGQLTEIQTVQLLLETIGDAWENPANYGLDKPFSHNVVLVATGFSESVLGTLSLNFKHKKTINVFPLTAPRSPIHNGQLHFLMDLAAVTGAKKVFDQISAPLEQASLSDLGRGVEYFEAQRYRSTIVGLADEDLVLIRAEEIKKGLENVESQFDRTIMVERLGKLTGGIAKLIVSAPSSGELREKRDRAEDATCAVRGTVKHGCLPGGGWTLVRLVDYLGSQYPDDEVVLNVLKPSLLEPVIRLLHNCGLNDEEIGDTLSNLKAHSDLTYDAMEDKWVSAITGGVLDSLPAVLEAIRNSISIASLLGTLGGTIVFQRDMELERSEAMNVADFMRSMNGEE